MLLRCAPRHSRWRWHGVQAPARALSRDAGAPRTSAALRSSFLEFFKHKGHAHVPSSHLVPQNDPSLLFTNAGMVQFKEYFLNLKTPPFTCATTVQKCLRVGGKHNDLDNVGYTARHQTFFEMLGNFSFGAYGKREAILYAWEYLTRVVQLPEERLSVSVLEGDEETAALWRNVVGLPDARIRRLGRSDNFWSMGAEGPCGPCTEIFWDQGHEVDGERFLEIWNLVFMELEQRRVDATRTELHALPRLCIDTGMGLERLSAVVQGVPTNFDIDSLAPARAYLAAQFAAQRVVARDAVREEVASRVIVDHVRAAALLLAEGVMPGAVGRAHVLRRLIRRASLHAWQCGLRDPLFATLLTPLLTPDFLAAYPELAARRAHVGAVLEGEERAFLSVFERALVRFEEAAMEAEARESREVSGEAAFALYASFGLPLDVTRLLAQARGLHVDSVGYEALKQAHAARSSAAWTGSGDSLALPPAVLRWSDLGVQTRFTGYDTRVEPRATILAAHVDAAQHAAYIALDPCPFYAEGGGQVGDVGTLLLDGVTLRVTDTQRAYEDCHVVRVDLRDVGATTIAALHVGAAVAAEVDAAHRGGVQRAHTATHLLNAALRAVLGPHVVQAGSRVEPDMLRFDFAHPRALTPQECDAVEDHVNAAIAAAVPQSAVVQSYAEATAAGALGVFSERYPERVRVVAFGAHSHEICGGTHAASTSALLAFKLRSEASVSLGKRRVEALVGERAVRALFENARTLRSAANVLHVAPTALPERIETLLKERAQLRALAKKSEATSVQQATESFSSECAGAAVRVHVCVATALGALKKRVLAQCDAEPDSLHVFLAQDGLCAALGTARRASSGAPHVGHLVRDLLAQVGAKGGGSAVMGEGRVTPAQVQTLLATLRASATSSSA